jgi:hypothetical protein
MYLGTGKGMIIKLVLVNLVISWQYQLLWLCGTEWNMILLWIMNSKQCRKQHSWSI